MPLYIYIYMVIIYSNLAIKLRKISVDSIARKTISVCGATVNTAVPAAQRLQVRRRVQVNS